MPSRLSRPLAVIAMLGLLTGCSTVKQFFGETEGKPLEGERISVLQLQKELVPNPELASEEVTLPGEWSNQFWPQRGGYPNHALGNLALGKGLKKAWKVSVGEGGDGRSPLSAAPVVAEGSVFTLDTEGLVSSFDVKNGKRKWKQKIVPKGEEDAGAVGGGLAFASGKIFAASGYKYIYALNPENGKILWKSAIASPARSAPTVLDERVYVVTLDNRLLVLNAADGTPLWNYAGVSETTNLLGSASPAVDQSLVVLPLSSGEIYGLRPENGQIVWEDNLSAVRRAGSLASISDIRGLPVIDQGVVYAVSFSGRMVALDQVSGQRIWQREIGSAETPWPAGESIFALTSEQQLTALTRKGGEIRWVTSLPRFEDEDKEVPMVWAGPVLAGGRLVVVSSGGHMAEVNPQDGKILRQQELGDGAHLAPVVAGNTMFILTSDGDLTAWR